MFTKFLLTLVAFSAIASAAGFNFTSGITLDEFKCALSPNSSNVTLLTDVQLAENWDSFNRAVRDANLSLTDPYEAATFLGSIVHNTDYLRSYVAVCARNGGTCNTTYDRLCPDCTVAPIWGHKYFPRGTMMIAYVCDYFAFAQRFGYTGTDSPYVHPDNIKDSSYKAHLSGAFAWQKGGLESCSDYTRDEQDFAMCLEKLHPWECTAAGNAHLVARIAQIERISNDCLDYTIPKVNLWCNETYVATNATVAYCPAPVPAPSTPTTTRPTSSPVGGPAPAPNPATPSSPPTAGGAQAVASIVSFLSFILFI